MGKEVFSNSSTTMLLEEILTATATYQNGIRYSLNSQVTERDREKSPIRLSNKIGLKVTECKFEIDHYGIDLIAAAAKSGSAAASAGTWDATVGNAQEWIWKKYQFLDRIEFGSNNIFAKTLRGVANVILAGNNVARVVRQLQPNFKPAGGSASAPPTGPHVLGYLDGRLVIQDPFLPTNEYTLGYKGDSMLLAGFGYFPYIPLDKNSGLSEKSDLNNSFNCWNNSCISGYVSLN